MKPPPEREGAFCIYMDDFDRLLLCHLKAGLNFTEKPFEQLARKLDSDSAEVLLRIQRLKERGVIYRLKSKIYKSKLPYVEALVGMKISSQLFDGAVNWISSHSRVYCSSKRKHDFNFWFWMNGVDEKVLREHLKDFAKEISSNQQVVFFHSRTNKKNELSSDEVDCLKVICEEFPIKDSPYEVLASKLKMKTMDFLKIVELLCRKGLLGRVEAELKVSMNHDQGDFVLWDISKEKLKNAALSLGEFESFGKVKVLEPDSLSPFNLYFLLKERDAFKTKLFVERAEVKIGYWKREVFLLEKEIKNDPISFPFQSLRINKNQNSEIGENYDIAK